MRYILLPALLPASTPLPLSSGHFLIFLIYLTHKFLKLSPDPVKKIKSYSSLAGSFVTSAFHPYPYIYPLIIGQGNNQVLNITMKKNVNKGIKINPTMWNILSLSLVKNNHNPKTRKGKEINRTIILTLLTAGSPGSKNGSRKRAAMINTDILEDISNTTKTKNKLPQK